MKKLLFRALGVFRVGATPPFNSSQSRLTILTNVLVIWGLFTAPTMSSLLRDAGTDASIYLPIYSILAALCLTGYFANALGKVRFAQYVVVILMNFTGFQAALFYGKSFNGYWGAYFIAIAYTVLAMSREPRWIFWPAVLLTLCGLPIIDWLHWHQLIPITGLNSSDYPLSILLADTIVFTFFLATMLTIEKSFYDSYEDELKNLNENLESIVEKRTQKLMEAKEEAVEASLLKSQFVANTSHELRTPVQGLVGFVEMAKKRLLKQSSLSPEDEILREKSLKSLASAEQSSSRLLELIDTLLKITRAESRGFVAKPGPFQVKSVIENLILDSQQAFPGQVIHLHLKGDGSGQAISDSTLVAQVTENLISNALRYSQSGSEIHVHLVGDPNEFHVHVINTGPGVSPEDVERIFDPFVQGQRTDQRTGGTGLGLALCRKYARALNGRIYLKNPSPESTEFVFDFPRYFSADPQKSGSSNGLGDGSPET